MNFWYHEMMYFNWKPNRGSAKTTWPTCDSSRNCHSICWQNKDKLLLKTSNWFVITNLLTIFISSFAYLHLLLLVMSPISLAMVTTQKKRRQNNRLLSQLSEFDTNFMIRQGNQEAQFENRTNNRRKVYFQQQKQPFSSYWLSSVYAYIREENC